MELVNIIKNYYESLRCSQLSKTQLLAIQEQRFGRLLNHAVKNSEYYQELYRETNGGAVLSFCYLKEKRLNSKRF